MWLPEKNTPFLKQYFYFQGQNVKVKVNGYWRKEKFMITRRQFCQNSLAMMAAAMFSGCLPAPRRESQLRITYPQSNQSFPVVIQHALGSTEIKRQPENIVILGMQTADIAFELGVIPLAMEANFWGGDESGFVVWYKQAVEQSGKKLPELINMYPEPDIEKLTTLKTDLILAPQSGMTASLFAQLSAIAPVVAYPERAWLTRTDELIDICAAALGRQPEVAALKQRIAQQKTQLRQQYPQFSRYKFAYVYAEGGTLSVYREGDTRVDVLSDLGLQLAPFVSQLPMRMGAFTGELGLENADKLNEVDVLITWFSSEQARDAMAQRPLFAQIPAVKRDSYIPLLDRQLASAMSYGTPLALAWGLPRFLPLLNQAIEKVG